MVVDSWRFNDAPAVLAYVLEGPDAEVSGDGIVCEVYEGLGAELVAEYHVACVFEVVALVFLAVCVDDGVDEVECEIKEGGAVQEQLLNLLNWSAGPLWLSCIIAGIYLDDVLRILVRRVLAFDADSGIHLWTEPAFDLQLIIRF